MLLFVIVIGCSMCGFYGKENLIAGFTEKPFRIFYGRGNYNIDMRIRVQMHSIRLLHRFVVVGYCHRM